jgi:hypothetical protein
VPFGVVDAGASEAGLVFGIYRDAKPDERTAGTERVLEYLEPSSIPWLGGERLLHRLAYGAYSASGADAIAAAIPFELPQGEEPLAGAEELLGATPEARANTRLLMDAIRPVLEGDPSATLPSAVKLLGADGQPTELAVALDRAALVAQLESWLGEGVSAIVTAVDAALAKIGRDPDPYDGFHLFLGGRLGMHSFLAERLASALPGNVALHRFKEPDKSNLAAPTVKTATALGVLAMKLDKVAAVRRTEERDAFRYRVGRARHGQLADVLDPAVDYDTWREMGACSKPDVEVLFLSAQEDGEVAADDPRVTRAVCSLGEAAVGLRVYLRAVGPTRVEVSAGPPGGEPERGASCWAVDLKTGHAEKVV